MTNHDPMTAIHALGNRIREAVNDLGVAPVRYVIIPMETGPDMIQVSFVLSPDSVKTSDEIESESLEDAFMDVLGDFTVEEDDEGNVVIQGAEAERNQAEEEDEELKEFRAKQRQELIESMRRSLLEEKDDPTEEEQ